MKTCSRLPRILLSALVVGAALLATSLAAATERHFTYTYESGVLAPGRVELEPWTTVRVGRQDFYSRIDNRLEFELGLSERLQTSLYLNTTATAQDLKSADGVVTRQHSFELSSISSEWKLKLSDPLAHPLGSALYLEASYGNSEAELEAKVIFDKRVKSLLFAANIVGELEWEFAEPGEAEQETAFELDLGAAYFLTQSLTLGAEFRPTVLLEEGELQTVALFGGPTLSTAYEGWWAALSVMPQLYSPKNGQGKSLDLTRNEHIQVRLLLGIQL